MLSFRPILLRFRRVKSTRKLLYIVSLLIFFWTIFDGILSYLVPILITQRGYSNTEMGLILAFSSVAGAVFDFILTRTLKNTNYLKTFLLILTISFTFPLVLWFSNHLFVYLLAMAIWGLYYDLYTFASYDFVNRTDTHSAEYSYDFGIIELFRSTAGFLAPLIAAWLIVDRVKFFNVSFPFFFLVIAAVFYLLLFNLSPVHFFHKVEAHYHTTGFLTELKTWRSVGILLLPLLIFMTFMYIFDAIFWTIGPLFSSSFPNFPYFSGVLMTLYNLPSLFTTWKIEALTDRFGKKATAFFTFILANLFLIPLGFIHSPVLVLFLVLLSSIASSITWPAILGAFSDYISQFPKFRSEIEGLTDFTINLGYIFGPILAGFLSDKIGISFSFGVLGLVDLFITVILIILSSKTRTSVLRQN